MSWGFLTAAIVVAALWRSRSRPWAIAVVAGLGMLGGGALFALLLSVASLPGPPASVGTWANGIPTAQTPTHVFLINAQGLHVASRQGLDDHHQLTWGGGVVRSTASNGQAVLITYYDRVGDEYQAGWGLAAPDGWLAPPHFVSEHGAELGAWWSPAEGSFFAASLSRPDESSESWTLRLERITAQGQVADTKSLLLTDPPAHWSTAARLVSCCVGDDVMVAALPGPACRLIVDDAPRCESLPGSDGARCNNDPQTYYRDGERVLAADGPRPFPWPLANDAQRPLILDAWSAFDERGEPTLVTKHWTGLRQEFRAADTLWITEPASAATTNLIEASLDGVERRHATVFGSSFLLVWPDARGVTLSGFDQAVRLDQDLQRVDPPSTIQTLRAYLSPWGADRTLFEIWIITALLLTVAPLLALSRKFRSHTAGWWVLLGVVAIEVGTIAQVLERLP